MAPLDTSVAARRQVVTSFAAMSGEQRLVHALEMADEAKSIAIAGIRSRHPELDDAGVHRAWLRLLHGDELAARLR